MSSWLPSAVRRRAARRLLLAALAVLCPFALRAQQPNTDFGDAPPPYPTIRNANGAVHNIIPQVVLGQAIDGEIDGQPNANATGDDINSPPAPTIIDDEDGVRFDSGLSPGSTAFLRVIASTPGLLNAWVDFELDGSWAGRIDQIFLNRQLAAGVNNLSFTVPEASKQGLTFARFRFSRDGNIGPAGPAGDGEVEDYAVTIGQPLDFGDAPQNYPTLLSNNGARHTVLPGFFMGKLADTEQDGQPSTNATGDDDNPPGAGDDEDGVTLLTAPINAGGTERFEIVVTEDGAVDAWMDFNGNGSWADAGEKVLDREPMTVGANLVSIGIPASIPAGGIVARFRFSSEGGLSFDGPAPDGEVEDYRFAIQALLDFGDAPDTPNGIYPTLLSRNGARHNILPGFHLGKTIDAEADGQPTSLANGDDTNPAGAADDEDGVVFGNLFLTSGQTAQVTVEASLEGRLDAWIDFNINASWLDAGEKIFDGVGLSQGPNTLTFTVPAGLQSGATFARFRFSSEGKLRPEGPAPDGEVEDYVVAVIGNLDYGDAPDPAYPTRFASDGARHLRNPDVFMGLLIDVESDGQPNFNATGDDLAGTGTGAPPDDEDGVVFTTPLHRGQTATVQIRASTSGFINAWVDFAGNGSWADPEDEIFFNHPVVGGINTLVFNVPDNLRLGMTFARFRFSLAGDLTYTGLAANGEVEDYAVFTRDVPVPCDQSNKGRDFWLTFPGNYAPDTNNPIRLTLSVVGPRDTKGTVTIPGLGYETNFVIGGSMKAVIHIPKEADLGDGIDVVQKNGIHVQADADVAVFGMNRVYYTTDGFLGLPSSTLGKNYLIQSFANVHTGVPSLNGTQFGIVACESNTVVNIRPSVSVPGHPAGITYSVTLQRGETYQLRGTNDAPQDLSGTAISADKPIAVFGSHQCANIPDENTWFCDYIVEQLLPIERAGRTFFTYPLATRTGGDTFRVLATADKTVVNINGVNVATIDRGQSHQTVINGPSQITANQPVLVTQYANSADFDPPFFDQGDPFMMVVPSVDMYMNNYMVCVPDAEYNRYYLNVIIPTAGISALRLNGTNVTAGLFGPIGATGWSGARIQVTPQVHNLLTTGTAAAPPPFAVFAYGWGEYDSFGYPGGFHFPDRTAPTITCLITNAVVPTIEGCSFPTPDLRQFVDVFDNCPVNSDTVAITQNPPPGTPLPVGSNVVTVFATDSEGNRDSCTLTIVVVDISDPQISCPQFINAACDSDQGAFVTFNVTAVGSCGGTFPVVCDPPSGTLFPVGDTLVTCTTTNLVGDFASCEFIVRVSCNKVSVAVSAPGQITVSWDGNGTLETADDPAGPWTAEPNARSPFPVNTTLFRQKYYRVLFSP